jgi:hypothetical protein
MRTDHRVRHRRIRRERTGQPFVSAGFGKTLFEAVRKSWVAVNRSGTSRIDGDSAERRRHAGEQRVAAERRNHLPVQHRQHRRRGLNVMSVCHISIFDGLSFVLSRICTSDVPATTVGRVTFDRPEPNCKCALLLRRHLLVAEEQHLMFEQRGTDRVEQRVRLNRIGYLHIVHERAQRAGGSLDSHLLPTAFSGSGFPSNRLRTACE